MARRRGSRTRLSTLFRRANRWQKAVAAICAVVAVHGVYVLFVPGVDSGVEGFDCPPAVVAAVAGSAGVPSPDDNPELEREHDAACAAQGRWWLLAGVAQTAVAVVWGLAVLEWGRTLRRARRAARRARRRQRAEG